MTSDQDTLALAGLQAKISAGLDCIGDQLSLINRLSRRGSGCDQERRDLWQMENGQAKLGLERSIIIDRIALAPRRPVVLVVEDETMVMMSIAAELRSAGFAVIEATNADEAIAALNANDTIDIMFTDVQMPGSMNGLELVAQVHRRWPSVRVLITSGTAMLTPGDLALGDSFISKPYSSSDVTAELRRQ